MAGMLILLLAAVVYSVQGIPTKEQLPTASLAESEYADDWSSPTLYEIEEDTGNQMNFAFIREADGHRMAEVKWIRNPIKSRFAGCHLYGDNMLIHDILKNVPKHQVHSANKNDMRSVISECTRLHMTPQKHYRARYSQGHSAPAAKDDDISKGVFIYPGTKWCGQGDIADSYEDLGPKVETDRCCRQHDHCNDTIGPYGEKYGLTNSASFTKSHCRCDEAFYKCLSEAATTTAVNVGNIYFNIVKQKCFKKDYPIVTCLNHIGIPIIDWSCQAYKLDTTKPKEWQFFDAKYFEK